MTNARTTSATDVEVVPATAEQEPVLTNLLELYAHDFSEFIELTLGPEGRFGYGRLHLYWKEPGRHPFIIKVDGRLAGFVFVRRGSEISGDAGVWDMAEFFVARGFRRHGVGTSAARAVWERFPGSWEVRVVDRNRKALEFWRRAVGEFLGREVEPTFITKEGQGWHVYSFETGRGA